MHADADKSACDGAFFLFLGDELFHNHADVVGAGAHVGGGAGVDFGDQLGVHGDADLDLAAGGFCFSFHEFCVFDVGFRQEWEIKTILPLVVHCTTIRGFSRKF